ncbi:MAG: hypothetical protein IJZ14_00640 [Oscillospiraceae bacterium]|nr:hypothetical protein [Oscillospiraceae bacterium]
MAQNVDVRYVQFYTHGSAAKRIAPAAIPLISALPKPKKRKIQRIYVDPVATLGIVVAVCMLVMMVVGISQLRVEQQKTAQMISYVERLQQENDSLQAEYLAECNMEEVERTALALGMIPREDALYTPIEVELPQLESAQQASIWQRIGTFLTGLFA